MPWGVDINADTRVATHAGNTTNNLTINNILVSTNGESAASAAQTLQELCASAKQLAIGAAGQNQNSEAKGDKPAIVRSTMSVEMQEFAINSTIVAFAGKNESKERAKYIMQAFEEKYGGYWNCINGLASGLGSWVRPKGNCYISLKVGDQCVVLFKSP